MKFLIRGGSTPHSSYYTFFQNNTCFIYLDQYLLPFLWLSYSKLPSFRAFKFRVVISFKGELLCGRKARRAEHHTQYAIRNNLSLNTDWHSNRLSSLVKFALSQQYGPLVPPTLNFQYGNLHSWGLMCHSTRKGRVNFTFLEWRHSF